jgi:hypothetical protein
MSWFATMVPWLSLLNLKGKGSDPAQAIKDAKQAAQARDQFDMMMKTIGKDSLLLKKTGLRRSVRSPSPLCLLIHVR